MENLTAASGTGHPLVAKISSWSIGLIIRPSSRACRFPACSNRTPCDFKRSSISKAHLPEQRCDSRGQRLEVPHHRLPRLVEVTVDELLRVPGLWLDHAIGVRHFPLLPLKQAREVSPHPQVPSPSHLEPHAQHVLELVSHLRLSSIRIEL